MAAEMQASRQELKDAQVDLAFRDNCAHILIPLNECRRQTYGSLCVCMCVCVCGTGGVPVKEMFWDGVLGR